MAPSGYFKRQCYLSVECDEELVAEAVGHPGDDRLVFSTDFPHPDSRVPASVEMFLKLPLSEAHKRKILWDNCVAFYGLQ
jgi:predicted TIM-barrel fold metal-dependent hydrolase